MAAMTCQVVSYPPHCIFGACPKSVKNDLMIRQRPCRRRLAYVTRIVLPRSVIPLQTSPVMTITLDARHANAKSSMIAKVLVMECALVYVRV
jgi:hypothetical protein